MLWPSSGRKWKLVREPFIFIAANKSSLAVSGSRYLPPEVAVRLPVGRPLTALQCSRPTPGDSLPPIPVEPFPSRCPLDVDGLFQQEFLRSPGPVNHRCVFPVDVVVASPGVLCNCRLLQRLGSAGIQGTPAGECLNRDGGKGIPRCWTAALKRSEGAANRQPNRNFRQRLIQRQVTASGDSQ